MKNVAKKKLWENIKKNQNRKRLENKEIFLKINIRESKVKKGIK